MLGPQAGDQPQDRALAAAAGPQHANKLSLVGQIVHDERDVANGREFVGRARVVGLGDAAKLDDMRLARLVRLANCHEHLAHPDCLARWVVRALWILVRWSTHGASGSAEVRGCRTGVRRERVNRAFENSQRKSSQPCSTARIKPVQVCPLPPYR